MSGRRTISAVRSRARARAGVADGASRRGLRGGQSRCAASTRRAAIAAEWTAPSLLGRRATQSPA